MLPKFLGSTLWPEQVQQAKFSHSFQIHQLKKHVISKNRERGWIQYGHIKKKEK